MFVARESTNGTIDGMDPNVNIGGTALGAIWFMASVAMLIVGIRVYTQARITRQVGWSDYLAIMSVVIVIIFASLISAMYHHGWGRHQVFIDDDTLQHFLRYLWAAQPFGIMGSTFGRLSFIILMLRLFGTQAKMRILLWTFFGLQLVTNLGTVVMLYAQCKDPRALYDFSVPSQCLPAYVQTYLGYGHTAFNGLTDLVLTAIPATMLWNIQMHRRLKIGLCALLGLSCVAFVGTVMKIVKLNALSNQADYTYTTVSMFTWVTAEAVLVDIAASIPLLRPLVNKLSGRKETTQSYDLRDYEPKPSQQSTGQFTRLGDNRMEVTSKSDTASEEGILPMQGFATENGAPGIYVKHSYIVKYNPS
ncbi:hypothetical protein BX600DRAFT_438868 [Xylariales sp. PMI_506]|nr:hypothetical protein BX600DRAFT_438868 [Xylariales sp. PMI_506]